MSRQRETSLIGRMIGIILLILIPFFVVITALFSSSVAKERADALDNLTYMTGRISLSLDDMAYRAYSASDAFSENKDLLDRIDRSYEDEILKQAMIVQVLNRLFESYNSLTNYEKIDAIYVQPYDELYDFLDPNQDEQLVKDKIADMNMNDPEKRGDFCWYPLQTNFLCTETYGDVRRDHVVFGSRRVYSALREGYPYVHVFALEENSFYQLYAEDAERIGMQVYIFNRDGGLLSSTEKQAVADCAASADVTALAQQTELPCDVYNVDGVRCYAARTQSEETGWTTLALLPETIVLKTTEDIYARLLFMALVCAVSSGCAVFFLYRRFMRPLETLDKSMKRVEKGDLQAYVVPTGEREMRSMLSRYNKMLHGIENIMDEQMKMERMKKDLEMQVLTVQINPHFLYNTLETIVWKAGEAGRPDIGRIAASLGKMYRLSVGRETFVALAQELEHLRAYAAIQSTRHGDKVRLSVQLRGVDPARCRILKLTLQPIVENCYLYAGEGLDRLLKIRVLVHARAGRLEIRITDNGVGMTPEQLEHTRRQMLHGKQPQQDARPHRSTGIGLHNIYARIHLYETGGDMQILSRKDFGTSVVLRLPLEELPDTKQE